MKKLILILWLVPFVLTAQTRLTYKTSQIQIMLNNIYGVTSPVQTQLNTKAPTNNPTFTTGITTPVLTLGEEPVTASAEELNILDNVETVLLPIGTITTIPTIYSAVGDTSNYPIPGKVGNIYIDSSAGKVYISVTALRLGWRILN